MKIIIYTIVAIVICSSACSLKNNSHRKPVTNIIITPSNKIITYGNEFSIRIESKLKNSDIEKIELYIDNKLLKTIKEESYSISFDSKKFLPGNHIFKTIATNKKGLNGINYNNFSIISNIIPSSLSYKLIEKINHNTKHFTEGFEFESNILYESTGDYGSSFVYEYDKNLKSINKSIKLDNQYFGEGITILNDKLYQLTYKSKIGFIYDLNSFKKIGEFNFESKEGWGLTNDGVNLIMSDGTSNITFINPSNFTIYKRIQVSNNIGFIENINELEYVDGYIFANIWTTDQIIKFDAETGRIVSIYNLSDLKKTLNNNSIDVLNGIAYNKKEEIFYITGKFWPYIFKIKFNLE